MNKYLLILIKIFIIINIFDPADLIFKLKVPLFLLIWVFFLFDYIINKNYITFSNKLINIVFIFISIPFFSILYYHLYNGSLPYAGFQSLKAYLYFTILFIFYTYNYNLLSFTSNVLTLLATIILTTYFIILVNPSIFNTFYQFGTDYGIFLIGDRKYDENLSVLNIYFVCSPMIAISISYSTYKFLNKKNIYNTFILFINIFGMFTAGTRNNMFVSILLPLSIFFIYSKNKIWFFLFSLIPLFFLIKIYQNELIALFSINETSNNTKIQMLKDYIQIFKNPLNLFFGQGLGSYYYWSDRQEFYYTTELTFLEIFRNFGLILGIPILIILLIPLQKLFSKNINSIKFLYLGYLFYLIMCFTNPYLFSSLGMLILSIVYFNYYKIL